MITARLRRIYQRLPDGTRPYAQKWYSILHPRISWPKVKRRRETTERFAERFFDDGDFEAYRSEFYNGPVVDICESAMAEMADRKQLFDAHMGYSARTYALVREREPETIVETGVYNGVATLSVLLALEENGSGTLYSVDSSKLMDGSGSDPYGLADRGDQFLEDHLERGRPSCAEPGAHSVPEGKSPGWIVPEDLREHWELTEGWTRRELPSLFEEVGPVDFFLHDSDHSTSGMLFEFELAWEWLNPGGFMASCHVEWNDAFDIFTSDHEGEHGLYVHDYSHQEAEYRVPCSCGYVIKPTA